MGNRIWDGILRLIHIVLWVLDGKREYVDEKDYYWANRFDYIMIADVKQLPDSLPLYVALMMKNDVVAAITFYYPTAG